MKWMSDTIERLDQATPKTLLRINIALSLFVVLAHGLPLLLVKRSQLPTEFLIAYVTAPMALVAALSGIGARFNPSMEGVVLKAHTVFLALMGTYMLYCSLHTLIVGVPAGAHFSWNPFLFGLVLAYPVYLMRRFLVPPSLRQSTAVQYAHVGVFVGSFAISAAVIARGFGQI